MSLWNFTRHSASILACTFAAQGCSEQYAKLQTVYNSDSRQAVSEQNAFLGPFSSSVALLTRSFRIQKVDELKFHISAPKFGDFFGLCSTEAFYNEPVLGDCTGFLVSDQLLVTAGHCISNEKECDSRVFIFNHFNPDLETFHSSQVHTCRRIVSSLPKSAGDLVLVELDRAVKLHPESKPFLLSKEEISSTRPDVLMTLGHPSGLSLKAAPFEGQTGSGDQIYFFGMADVSGGSSGSPLFDPQTGRVHGVLVGGENDFVWDTSASCSRSRVCTSSTCVGERFATQDALAQLFTP
jgi:hypothetical protein